MDAMGASHSLPALPASLPEGTDDGRMGGTDEGRPDASRPSVAVTAQQSHGLGGRHIEPASWGGVKGGLGSGSRWAGLGQRSSQVDQGHSTPTALHSRHIPGLVHSHDAGRAPARMVERCLAAPQGAILPAAAAMEGAKKWRNTAVTDRSEPRYAFFNITRISLPSPGYCQCPGSASLSSWSSNRAC